MVAPRDDRGATYDNLGRNLAGSKEEEAHSKGKIEKQIDKSG